MRVEQLRPHLWRWTAQHPDWTSDVESWGPDVASVAVVGDELVLIDPLVPTGPDRERFWAALDRDAAGHGPPKIVLTVPWHARSTADILRRYDGAELWLSEAAEETGLEPASRFAPTDELPGGLRAYRTAWYGEVELWIPAQQTLVTGDVLLGSGGGGLNVCPDSWLGDVRRTDLIATLQPLLELPVEIVIPTHGDPVLGDGAQALRRALAA